MSERLEELSSSLTVRTRELGIAITKLTKDLKELSEELNRAKEASRNSD